ncbi:MAG: MFS transporter [Polyangiales bacterium]
MPSVPVTAPTAARDFRAFWLGQAVSAAGDAFSRVALPLLVLDATGSLVRMGQLSAVSAGAWLLAGLASGSVVDRVDRRRLLVACDLGQGLAYATVPLAWWLRGPSLPWLFAVAAVGAALGNLHRAAAGAAVQRLVPRDRLLDANASMHAAGAVAGCVGPLVAGLACARFGAVTGVAVDAASFLVAAAATTTIRTALDPDVAVPTGGLLDDLRVGFRFLRDCAELRAPLAVAAVAALFLAGRDNLVVYHLRRDLGLGEAAVGATFAAASVGSLAGASIARRLRDRVGFAASWLGAGAVMGAALAGVGVAGSLVAVAALAAVLAACETVRGINTVTLRQEATPAHLLGRVTAVWWAFVELPNTLGAHGSAALAARHGVPLVLAASGAALLAVVALGAAWWGARTPRPALA